MLSCPSCGAEATQEDAFCGMCGAALGQPGTEADPPTEAMGVVPPASAMGSEQPELAISATRARRSEESARFKRATDPPPRPQAASLRNGEPRATHAARTCPNCSCEVADDATICLACGFELVEAGRAVDPPEVAVLKSGRRVIAGSPIVLGDGERVWRQYHVTGFPELRLFGITLSRAKGAGALYVTDSRVLFYATLALPRGRRSALVQETQLEHITGLVAFVSRRWGWLGFVITAAVGLIGAAMLKSGPRLLGFVLLALAVIGIILLLQGLALRGTVGVRISSGAAQSTPLGFGDLGDPSRGFFRSLMGPFGPLLTMFEGPRDATDLLLAMPGPDAERVIVELGALIADLQAKGSLAETHWGIEGDGAG